MQKQATLTAASAKINSKFGASFAVYDGSNTGKNLQLMKDRLIVQ
jgi:hypothetical protein